MADMSKTGELSPCLHCVKRNTTSCSSDRSFAADFLQIPPRDGHPCLGLAAGIIIPALDFHQLVSAHAGRTMIITTNNFILKVLAPKGSGFRPYRKQNYYEQDLA